jgi:hypothetical protein
MGLFVDEFEVLAFWSTLQKLNMASILAGVSLPIRITAAYVRTLRIKLSWAALFSSPMSIELEGLYVVASMVKAVPVEDAISGESLSQLAQSSLSTH